MSHPGLVELYTSFLFLGLSSFGGALPWARRVIVERRRFLSGDQFVDLLSLCQFLPGPNILNVSVALGARAQGVRGSLAASLGFTLVPFLLFLGIGELYMRGGDLPLLRGALDGVGAAAAGMLAATAVKIGLPLVRRRPFAAAPFIVLTFAAVGLMRWPLLPVILLLAPFSFAVAWWRR
ncbi:MAG: chromate transporter [Chloroflexi bacterium]|nr:chromate transporter [Chloroflexota bacterium]